MAKRSKKGRMKRDRKGMGIIAAVVLILCVVLAYNSHRLDTRLAAYDTTAVELQKQIDEQKEIKQALEEKSDYINSDAYYKELAREKLGLADSNDIIFKKQ